MPATAGGAVRKYHGADDRWLQHQVAALCRGRSRGRRCGRANQLTREACDAIKADSESRIDIFTIAFEVADEGVKDILRYCATPGGAFFDAVDYSRLLTAFSEIGSSVNVARLAK